MGALVDETNVAFREGQVRESCLAGYVGCHSVVEELVPADSLGKEAEAEEGKSVVIFSVGNVSE